MPVKKKTFIRFEAGDGQSLFYRAWRIMNLDGPLCPLHAPMASEMAALIEQQRKQQVHVDEIKRMCHVRTD